MKDVTPCYLCHACAAVIGKPEITDLNCLLARPEFPGYNWGMTQKLAVMLLGIKALILKAAPMAIGGFVIWLFFFLLASVFLLVEGQFNLKEAVFRSIGLFFECLF